MNVKSIQSVNYQILQEALSTAFEHNQFIGVIGDSGWGKSWNFDLFEGDNKNVFIDRIEPTMDTKIFFNEVLEGFNRKDLTTNKLFYAIRNASNIVKELNSKSMFIIDEAGNFKMSMQKHLRQFRDKTKNSSSMVISGPYSFYDDLLKCAENNRYGIKEMITRVNRWVFLEEPTEAEFVAVCKMNGFDANVIPELIVDCDNFRTLRNNIINYWIDNGLNSELESGNVGAQA